MIRRIMLTSFLIASWVEYAQANTITSFEEARRLAFSTGKPIVIDFFTSWCAPCKAFEKATTEEDTILNALNEVVLLTVDAWESEEGRALASRYRVRGYPTFVVVDSEGAEKNRWSGYTSPEIWAESLNSILEAEGGITELQNRYDEKPDSETAEQLAVYYQRSNNPLKAVSLYNDLLRMRPEKAGSYLWTIFTQLAQSFGREHEDIARLRAAHDQALELELKPAQWAKMATLLKPVAWQVDDPDWYGSVIPRVMAATQDSEDQYVMWVRSQLAEDVLIYVQKRPEEALARQRSTLDPNWQDSVRFCMTFGTWCQENRINMAEAQRALEKVLNGESHEEDKLLLGLAWSTLGDLRATRGEYASAVVAVNRAIDYMPGVPELYDAQRRYENLRSRLGE